MSFRKLVMIFGFALFGPMCNSVNAQSRSYDFTLCYRRAVVTDLAEAVGIDLSVAEEYMSVIFEEQDSDPMSDYAMMHYYLISRGESQEAIEIVRKDIQPDSPLLALGMINCIREFR